MLWSMIAAIFRLPEIYIYGVFSLGFVLAIIPTNLRTTPLLAIFPIAISLIALQFPLSLPNHLPGLIRLGIIIGIWTFTLLILSWIGSAVLKKWSQYNGG